MFVSKTLKATALTGLAGIMTLAGATASVAVESDATDWKIRPGNIPVTVTITNIDPAAKGNDPVYVSIQTRDEFRSMRGAGGIAPYAKTGSMTATFPVAEPGEYAVSVWHDRDGDGRFSMTEDYTVVLDSYAASGHPPKETMPTFDDVKFTVPNMGTELTVEMRNPDF